MILRAIIQFEGMSFLLLSLDSNASTVLIGSWENMINLKTCLHVGFLLIIR